MTQTDVNKTQMVKLHAMSVEMDEGEEGEEEGTCSSWPMITRQARQYISYMAIGHIIY